MVVKSWEPGFDGGEELLKGKDAMKLAMDMSRVCEAGDNSIES
jgi:hypothetical protein